MISLGTDGWTSSGLSTRIGLEGDFDVALTFDDLKLGKPKEKMNSALYFQLEFPDPAKTQANVLFAQHADDRREIYVQIRTVDAGGSNHYHRVRTDQVDRVDRLRMARRGKDISFLYRVQGAEDDTILVQREVLAMPVPKLHLRVLLHTGGDDRQSEVTLRRLSVRADTIRLTAADSPMVPTPLVPTPLVPPPLEPMPLEPMPVAPSPSAPKPTPSLLDSLRNLFK